MKQETQKILLSPYFLIGLFLLLLNDFLLKQQFHNFFTGKLSDFAGLFIFPLFFAAFFPKRKLLIYISTAILFIFWKSPFSQSLIDLWNSVAYFKVERIIDYSDILALLILPVSYLYFVKTQINQNISHNVFIKQGSIYFVILISVFAFTATSVADERSVSIEGEYNIKLNHTEIENVLKQNKNLTNLKIERQTDVFPPDKYPDVKSDPNLFFADFTLNQKICDTEHPTFSFVIIEGKDSTIIKIVSSHFRCKAFASDEGNSNVNLVRAIKKYQPEIQAIFEREVIEKLRQNNSQ